MVLSMKIVLVNKFLFPKGGDANCTIATGALLRSYGHSVFFWGMKHPDNMDFPHSHDFVENIDYERAPGILGKFKVVSKILYSFEARRKFERFILKTMPDVVHLNNFAHQISPSILHVLKKYKIPAVMTMHDYKMTCPSYSLYSGGTPCEKCKGGSYYWCTIRKCTKDSYLKSSVNTLEMYLHHRILRIYEHIHTFISPSKFLAEKVVEMGLKGRFRHLPNFVDFDVFPERRQSEENSCTYFGRLSEGKGLVTLLDSVKGLGIHLKIIGEGPQKNNLMDKVTQENINNVSFLGFLTGMDLYNEICKSKFIVITSECYENNPLSVIESFSMYRPVVGAKIGGIPELVIDGQTGSTFISGNKEDLREKIIEMTESANLEDLGSKARLFVEENLSSKKHYHDLMEIYVQAICRQ